MRLKINNVSHGAGRCNSAKCWQVPLYSPSLRIHKCPFLFSRDKLIQVLSSQEVTTESRWTLSHLVILGTEARLHCRYVLHFSTASSPGQDRSYLMPGAGSWDAWVRRQSPRIPQTTLLFQDLQELAEPSSAYPPEFGMTVVHNRDMIRTRE